MPHNNLKSTLIFVFTLLVFGTIGIFRRFIPLSSALLACLRGLLGSGFLFLYAKLSQKKSDEILSFKTKGLLALTGALIGVNWVLLFEAYRFTTIAKATLCYYMAPLIVLFLSPVFFREKLTPQKLICALVALLGMVFVSGVLEPSQEKSADDLLGMMMGLGAACLYASVIMLNKKIDIQDMSRKTIIQLFSAAIVLVPYLLLTKNFFTEDLTALSFSSVLKILLPLLLVGILHTGIAYLLYFRSIVHLSAQTVAILSYVDPASALLFSAFLLNEKLTLLGLLGAVLIIGSAVLSEIPLRKK